MKEVIAMHGWCSDSKFWENWETLFKRNEWFWESADRGYTKKTQPEPIWKPLQNPKATDKRVLICHSLGAHLVSQSLIKKATHMIFINSFSRFIPIGKDSRSLKVGLVGMQRQINAKKEKEMINLFWQKATFPNKLEESLAYILSNEYSSENIQKLQDDLNLLIKTKRLPHSIKTNTKVLIINGESDKIIHPNVRKELINELSQYLDTPPDHWIIKNEGHVILSKEIIERARMWLESN